jgi:outer membrane protein assembly factor BamE (lipoprotein component of BamABCDE complex)
MHRRFLPTLFATSALLLLSGCATPQARIKQNPQLFSALSPEAKTKVQAGIIELGYTQDMVFLAAGKPTYVQTRLDDDGKTTVWRYTAYRWTTSSDVWPRRYGPWWHDSWYREDREEYDVLRVEFRDGKVAAIEHIER